MNDWVALRKNAGGRMWSSLDEWLEFVAWSGKRWRRLTHLEGAVPLSTFPHVSPFTFGELVAKAEAGVLRTAYRGEDCRWRVRLDMELYRREGMKAALLDPRHWRA
jgi:hypothetical protein